MIDRPTRPWPRRCCQAWPVPSLVSSLLVALLLSLLTVAGPARAATVSGFVRSAATGEALDYANVFLQGTSYGDMTNAKGFYSIPGVPAGEYTLAFSFIGYALETRPITLVEGESVLLSVELRPQAIQLDAVEVKAEGKDPTITPSRLTLRTGQLSQVPRIAEADLFRAVQALPGVSTLSDFSSGLYVRGGSPDQNLILLDDVDVYNPSHLFGFFSTFNVDAVKTVDLQKSGYPVRYGGRLSSLLDVHNRDGNRKTFEGVGRIGLISSGLTLEGPWRRGSWMVSGRRTHLELLAKAADIDLPYNFYDLHGKVNLDFRSEDRVAVSLFRGKDRLDWEESSVDILLAWGNDTWSSQWTHIWNSRVFSHFILGGSRFTSEAEIAFQDFEFRFQNRIDDLAAKGNLSIKPTSHHLVDFGFETKLLDFSWKREIGEGDRLQFGYDGTYAALYAQDAWTVSRRWRVQPGLRLDHYSEGNHTRLGPRCSVRRQWNEMLALTATGGRYYQFLNLVSEEGASFADMWFPVDETLQPGRADHYIAGLELGPYEEFDLSVEAYYKDYRNLVEFSREFTRSLVEEDAELGELFNTGTGEAYGADVYLRNRWAGFDGWIGYAWGVAKRKDEQFNRGEEFTPVYDRRHQITVMQSRPLGNGFTLDLAFRYGTGQPTTLAAGRYTVRDLNGNTYDTTLPGPLHEGRLPAFHRLDVGVSKGFDLASARGEASLQLINLYNRDNVYLRAYDLEKNPAEYEDVTMLPFLPTVGLTVRF